LVAEFIARPRLPEQDRSGDCPHLPSRGPAALGLLDGGRGAQARCDRPA
jgi:hypothetical protein